MQTLQCRIKLKTQEDDMQEITKYEGKTIKVISNSPSGRFWILFSFKGIELSTTYSNEADCLIDGNGIDLLKLFSGKHQKTFTHQSRINRSGQTEIIDTLLSIMNESTIDWRYELSKHTGYPLAHIIWKTGHNIHTAINQLIDTGTQNLSEYLQEELRILPSRNEINYFITEIKALQHATKLLETHINNLTPTNYQTSTDHITGAVKTIKVIDKPTSTKKNINSMNNMVKGL